MTNSQVDVFIYYCLFRYLNEWRAEHNNDIPQNYKEKTQFKENIRKGKK